jgi:hypothetical protein
MTALSNELGAMHAPIEWRRRLVPPLAGLIGALALIGLYLSILSLLQSPAHAFEQLAQDWLWVGLVALGFGTQVGLYTYLRQIIQAMQLAGADALSRTRDSTGIMSLDGTASRDVPRDGASQALTGAGTGTSTLGMVACCAHHITDIAPLLGLTGASGLSGVVTFLGVYKIPFIIFGLLVNLVGIVVSLRTIRKQKAHLRRMTAPVDLEPVACH